jgi:hypothetical protein
MRPMKTYLLPVIFLMVAFTFTKGIAQDAMISIDDVSACDSTLITTGINVENLIDVGAMTLEIAFDTAVLNFDTIVNIHPQFAGMLFNVLYNPQPRLIIFYSSFSGTSLVSGKLLDMVFFYKSEQSALHFLPNCELITPGFQTIEVDYTDGLVNHLITVTEQPGNQTVRQPEGTSFSVDVQVDDPVYQWQISYNNGNTFQNLNNSAVFQGVQSDILTLNSTTAFLNGTLFRCKIASGDCSVFSNAASLLVLPPLINQEIALSQGWNSLSTYLDPVEKDLTKLFKSIENQLIILTQGELVYYPQGNINTIGDFDPLAGYTIKVAEATNLTVSGDRLDVKMFQLPEGWSLLPVLTDCDVSVEEVFGKIINETEIIKEIAGVNCYWPEKDISSLQNLSTGNAYLVKMKSDQNISFPDCD